MYESLAKYYDDFMQEVPYDEWADFLASIIGDGKEGMDVGCGSGALTVRLAKKGYAVTGSDVSPQMLSVCAQKLGEQGLSVPLVLQSADKLLSPVPLDFITASCDVVNYLRRPEKFFARAYNNLKKGGVLIFDVSTEYKLRSVLANNVFTEERDGVLYVWENYLNAKSVDMVLNFFEEREDGAYERTTDEQTQYIHSEEDVLKALKSVGFKKIKTCGFLKKSRPKQNAERVHFIAYK